MASRDVRLELDPKVSVVPQSIGGAVNGTGIDLSGAEAALIILNRVRLPRRDREDSGVRRQLGYTDVADTDLIGTSGNTSGVARRLPRREGVYIGSKRYHHVRVVVRAHHCGHSAALFPAEVVRAHLRHAGTLSQPV
jgi:hypothetical protein